MQRTIIPAVDPNAMRVRLECIYGTVVTINDGVAICPECGARAPVGDLLEDLRQYRQSLDILIDALESAQFPPSE